MAKQFDYFAKFVEQTDVALEEAQLLHRVIENFTTAADMHDVLEEAHALEHRGDNLTHSIHDQVAADFITPFDRDDILALTECLDSIADQVEDVIQSFYMYDVHVMREDAIEFANIIVSGAELLHEAALEFKNYKKPAKLRELIIKVNDCEEVGDRLYQRAMRNLYTTEHDVAMRVVVWSQLYNRLEKTTDAFEHAADVMSTTILKNS